MNAPACPVELFRLVKESAPDPTALDEDLLLALCWIPEDLEISSPIIAKLKGDLDYVGVYRRFPLPCV